MLIKKANPDQSWPSANVLYNFFNSFHICKVSLPDEENHCSIGFTAYRIGIPALQKTIQSFTGSHAGN